MRVFVYFNLHKKRFSIKAMEGPNKGRVIHHADQVTLRNTKAKVSEAGRQRVLREQRKNVHAGIVGELVSLDVDSQDNQEDARLYYNPYKVRTFVDVETGFKFTSSETVHISKAQGIRVWNPVFTAEQAAA